MRIRRVYVKTKKLRSHRFWAILCILVGTIFAPARPVAPDQIIYFVGKWSVVIKSDPTAAYSWTVTNDLKGEWLIGVVEKNGERISTDMWRMNGGLIERFAFTSDGLSIKMVSSGWKSSKLVLNGIANGKTGDFRVRETIIKGSESKFHAIWERQGDDGKWSEISDETCSK